MPEDADGNLPMNWDSATSYLPVRFPDARHGAGTTIWVPDVDLENGRDWFDSEVLEKGACAAAAAWLPGNRATSALKTLASQWEMYFP